MTIYAPTAIVTLREIASRLSTERKHRDRLVVELAQAGVSRVAIAEAAGLSRARVYQLLKEGQE